METSPPTDEADTSDELSTDAQDDGTAPFGGTIEDDQPTRLGPHIRYLEGFRYVFDNPNWVANLMTGSLAMMVGMFIPVVANMVFSGYLYQVTESLFRQPTKTYPDFDYGKMGDYLGRALWPYVLHLFWGLLIGAVFFLFYVGSIVIMVVVINWRGEPMVVAIVSLVTTIILVLIGAGGIFVTMLATPLLLRAGLSQEFTATFNIAWLRDFARRMWLELLLGSIFMLASAFVLTLIGSLFFCIGMFPAMALLQYAQTHYYYQLYELYLTRGGDPIRLKPREKPKQFIHRRW